MGYPKPPSAIMLEPVPLPHWLPPGAVPRFTSDGLVAWQKTPWVTILGTAAPGNFLHKVFEIGGDAGCAPQGPDNIAQVSLLSSRINFRILVVAAGPDGFGPEATTQLPPIQFEVGSGFSCDTQRKFGGTFTPSKSGVSDLVQISGLLTDRWSFSARSTGAANVEIAINFQVDRNGGPYQIVWGEDVNKTFPVGAPLTPFHVLP